MAAINSLQTSSAIVFVSEEVDLLTSLTLALKIAERGQENPILINTEHPNFYPSINKCKLLDFHHQEELDLASILKKINAEEAKIAILLSLTPILLQNSLQESANFILSLQKKFEKLVVISLDSCLEFSSKIRLSELFRTSISLNSNNQGLFKCVINNRPINGKPSKKAELISIKGGKIEIRDKIEEKASKIEVIEGDKDEDTLETLKNLTTFEVGLTDLEKQNRKKVVLPFWKKEQKEEEEEENEVRIAKKSTSKIFYAPDEADDWDEEDPDDDLDF